MTNRPPECQLAIDVPIPSVQVLHTVSLTTIAEDGSRGTTKMMALGDVLMTELEIKHTRRWDSRPRPHHRHRHYHSSSFRQGVSSTDKQKEMRKPEKATNDEKRKKNEKRRKSTEVPSKNSTAGVEVPAAAANTAASASQFESESKSESDAIEFIYEIRADPNKWLVAGQRRARFTVGSADGGEGVHRFRVFLIPLVTGDLLFPGVGVKVFEQPKCADLCADADVGIDIEAEADADADVDGGGGGGGGDGGEVSKSGETSKAVGTREGGGLEKKDPVTFETDYLSQSESIVVVPNVRSCTVCVGFGGRGDEEEKEEGEKKVERGAGAEAEAGRRQTLVQTRLIDVEYRTEGFGSF